jgi:hypothetical protein
MFVDVLLTLDDDLHSQAEHDAVAAGFSLEEWLRRCIIRAAGGRYQPLTDLALVEIGRPVVELDLTKP